MLIRDMTPDDAETVLEIYRQGMATGHATFERDAPDWAGFDAKRMKSPRLVAEIDGAVVAWAAMSAVSDRCVYGGVAENIIYVSEAARGRGVGRRLLSALIEGAEAEGVWTLQAGIMVENEGSVRLHEACGFRIVGKRERLGKMSYGPMEGKWRDIYLMERRSDRVGID